MEYEMLKCPGCGAKFPPPAYLWGALTCEYCGATAVAATGGWPLAPPPRPEPPFAPHLPRATVAGVRYVLLGRLGQGDGSDVFLARRDTRLSEQVVLKVARALETAGLVAREFEVVGELLGSKAQGAEHFSRLLPQPVAQGPVKDPEGTPRAAAVYRWRSGFQHTFSEVLDAYPSGVDPRAAVWMWKRVLEMLAFVHGSGYVHGAVLPPHLLVHPRDHGVVLVGWSSALRFASRQPLPARSQRHRPFYPPDVWDGAPPTPATDLAMSARSLVAVLGGEPETGQVPLSVPPPLADLLKRQVNPAPREALGDAWQLRSLLDAAAKEAFGPPRYTPFTLPGWS
ncbi:gp247, putative [Stigmatella aurantiaca DW4/3-1]|uniref:Gp247, putative n=2 Tax=Stigmatella aurantiaca TaxID=41 RepID=Q090V8_STIAD|nr:gp247, putative [Stigmatella aurantiaca DW4/3-1]